MNQPGEHDKIPTLRKCKVTAICIILFLAVAWAFLPSIHNGFVDLDDSGYIYENAHVQKGLTWPGVLWALSSFVGGSWHPLTWLSIMLDCQLFGLHPAGHHFTALLLHAINTALLFIVLRRMTAATWRSAFVALLFGLHPLHVESVAWASERKDVLSTLFWLLSLWFYTRFAQESKAHGKKASLFYALTLGSFACGLMCKPMLVTLPLILLLLDWWPLQRFQFSTLKSQLPVLRRLLAEKLPFLVLSLLIGLLTLHSQAIFGALSAMPDLKLRDCISNAMLSYLRYLAQMAWPAHLAIFYPYPQAFPIWITAGACLALLVASTLALRAAAISPYAAFGWIWYVITLVPVIGLVQAGGQSHADRYTYVPLIGVFMLLVWGAHDLTKRWRFQRLVLLAAGAAAILPCVALTRLQIRYWKDSESLFRHALAATRNNELAQDILGTTLIRNGRLDEGIEHLQAALQLAPGYARAHNDLGVALGRKGREQEAVSEFQEALKLGPNFAEANGNLGLALEKQGRLDEAISYLEIAVRGNPDSADAHRGLAIALDKQGRLDEAIGQMQEAALLSADSAAIRGLLGVMLGKRGRLDLAAIQLREAVALAPGDAEAHCNLGITLGRQGHLPEAIEELRAAIEINPNSAEAHCNLGAALGAEGHLDDAIIHLREAVKLKPGYVDARNNLRNALEIKSAETNRPHRSTSP